MSGDVAFKEQEIENDLRTLVDCSRRLGRSPHSLHPNAVDSTVPCLNCSWVIAYMQGLICRGHTLSSEGKQRVSDLYARFNGIQRVYHLSRRGERATRAALFAALLSGDTQYSDDLLLSGGDEETVIRLELKAALQLGCQQDALELLEALLKNNQNRFWELDPFPIHVLQCGVRQQLDVFVQTYLDRKVGHRMEESIKCLLRIGSDGFIARLRLPDTAEALDAREDLNEEKEAALKALQNKRSFFYSFSPDFEAFVMGLDARRGLQLRHGQDADIDEIYKKADRQAYASIMQNGPRRSVKIRVKQNISATLILCAGLVLAVSAACAVANANGMRWSK